MEFKKAWIKTKNALLVLLVACVGFGASSTFVWGNTANSGYELNYFHAYRAARTYAIQLQNGLAATFDFRQGTATLYSGPQQFTLPLDQVLLQAANGNSNLAAQMYNQMYGGITAAHSDAIIQSIGTHTNSLRALSVGPGARPVSAIKMIRYGGGRILATVFRSRIPVSSGRMAHRGLGWVH